MKRADLAMYQAKAEGRNSIRFFDPDMQKAINARFAMENELRQALALGQFRLYYQSQVDERSHVVGAEALIRWQHPVRGIVAPGEFIALAEEAGLIGSIGQWVLETACAQLAAWESRPGFEDLSLSVNVSALQVAMPNFVEQVSAALDRSGTRPGRLKLELTEGVMLKNADDVVRKMLSLRARDVRFALDDFGTGYSSLSYLKRLPLDQLKIDQSFVRDILIDDNDAAIAKAVITLAHSLGISVIAEGVETQAQREILALHGCNHFQGYLFSRPVCAEDFENAFARSSAT
jgi:EAL domain-containing protein (putative c-di-GMP-specific phosphodiesterase class I)